MRANSLYLLTMTNMALQPSALPDRLFIDLALEAAPVKDVCRLYGIAPEALEALRENDEFATKLLQAKQAVDDDGRSFRARCRTAVHLAIPKIIAVVNDPKAPHAARIEAFKSLVKYGQLEPKETQAQGGGAHLTLTIVAPDGARMETRVGRTIEHQYDADDDLTSGVEWDDE